MYAKTINRSKMLTAMVIALLAVTIVGSVIMSNQIPFLANAAAGEINTYAGGGTLTGDGGPAIDAVLKDPSGIALDSSGNLYIADTGAHSIRKVDTSGVITSVIGTGVAGFSGDSAMASAATLSLIYSRNGSQSMLAFDSAGNLYISDSGNNRIRKVVPGSDGVISGDSDEIITTVAGGGPACLSTDPCGDGGSILSATLSRPSQVIFDSSGNMYISDTGHHKVRKVVSGIISTVAGNGISLETGASGPATTISLDDPLGLGFDSSGRLYIGSGNQSASGIRRVDTSGIMVRVEHQTGHFTRTRNLIFDSIDSYIWNTNDLLKTTVSNVRNVVFRRSEGGFNVGQMAFDSSGNLYVLGDVLTGCCSFDLQVFKINAGTNGLIDGYTGFNSDPLQDPLETRTLIAGNGQDFIYGEGVPATDATLRGPQGVATDSAGNIYIADTSHNRVRRVDAITKIITTVAGTGTFGYNGDGIQATDAHLRSPFDVAVDSLGNVYIADANNNRIRKVDTSGIISTVAGSGIFGFAGDGGPAVNARFRSPFSIDIDSNDNLYIADSSNFRIRKVDTSGIITTVAGNGLNCFYADREDCGDGGSALDASFRPFGVAADSTGNLYISDLSNRRIRKVSASGIISTVVGDGIFCLSTNPCGDGGLAVNAQISTSYDLTVDLAGNLYIPDGSASRIRRVDFGTQIITTVAGTGVRGFSGDGGPAVNAKLNFPRSVAVDPSGNLFIADPNTNRIRIVEPGICGDNAVGANEQCDDGGTTGGDGCSAQCLLEFERITGNSCVDSTCQVLQGCYEDDFSLFVQGLYVACVAEAAQNVCNLSGSELSTVLVNAAQSDVNNPTSSCGL